MLRIRLTLSRSADSTSFPPLIPLQFVGLHPARPLRVCGRLVCWPSACPLSHFVLDCSMNRCVGPLLLLGLGLCAASGCASSGPSRMSGLAQRMPWMGEKSSRSESSRKGRDSQGIVSFRAPNQRAKESSEKPAVTPGPARRERLASAATSNREPIGRSTPVSDSTPSPSFAQDVVGSGALLGGHSSDRAADLPRDDLSRQRSAGASGNSNVTLAGHIHDTDASQSSPRGVVPAIAQTIEPLSDDEASASNVTTANYRSDRDALDNSVQLQGFEALVPLASATTAANPNEPPLWPSRPVGAGGSLGQPAALKSTGERSPSLLAPGVASKSGGRVHSVNAQSAPAVPPGPWQADLERLIVRAERDVASLKPGSTLEAQAEYRRRQVHLRLLYLMAQRQEQALTVIPGLEPAEQEYWQQLCWAASNSLDAEQFPSPRDRAARSIAPLNTALRRLREQSDLAIKNIAFCEQISYFGNYQKFARDEFTPGQEVLLYAEIENFNTDQTADGEHRTLLRSVIDIVGSNGEARWHKTFPATEDRCRNPRRDYFHNYQFAIPDRLPLGPHTLKLTVVDDLSGKQASYELNFLVK